MNDTVTNNIRKYYVNKKVAKIFINIFETFKTSMRQITFDFRLIMNIVESINLIRQVMNSGK